MSESSDAADTWYGQEYEYLKKNYNGQETIISSGVASYDLFWQ